MSPSQESGINHPEQHGGGWQTRSGFVSIDFIDLIPYPPTEAVVPSRAAMPFFSANAHGLH